MDMRKDKNIIIPLIFILFFIGYFIYIKVFNGDIIVIPSRYLRPLNEEYFSWYWWDYSIDNVSSNNITICYLARIIFSLIFSLDILYLLSNEKYRNIIGLKSITKYIVIGISIYLGFIIMLNYKITHYRLYMTLYPTGILAIISLALNIKLKRE
jgi:hypothetical protein